MIRPSLVPMLPMLAAAGALSIVETDLRRDACDPQASRPIAPPIELHALPDVGASRPTAFAKFEANDRSRVLFRIARAESATMATASIESGTVECDGDGLPSRVTFRMPLSSIRSSDRALARDVLGVHRNDTMEFVGVRTATRSNVAAGRVLGLEFAGSVSLGPAARRVVVSMSVLYSPISRRLRFVGCGPIQPSEFGLPSRWGLGPWTNETTMSVACDLWFDSLSG